MKIPFMRLDRQYESLRDEILSETKKVLEHGMVLQGPEVAVLEKQLCENLKLSDSALVGSGSDALFFAMLGLGARAGIRIAVTGMSFVASASSIVRTGAEPVFVGVDEYYLTRPDLLLELVRGGKIDGILAVHLFGQMMHLEEVYHEASKRGIWIVEDAAQCFGATGNGFCPGRFSNAVCFSFDPTKPLGAYGSGGAVLSNDSSLIATVKKWRYHGRDKDGEFQLLGYNSQMASLQAAYVLVKMRFIDEWLGSRIAIAKRYIDCLANVAGLEGPRTMPGNTHTYQKFVVQVDHGLRDRLREYLSALEISTAIHYLSPLYALPTMQKYERYRTESIEVVGQDLMSLPIYPELKVAEIDYITKALENYRAYS